MGKLQWLFFVLTAVSIKSIHCKCPAPELIVPCMCDDEYDQVSITCIHKEIDGIYEALDEMSKKKLTVNIMQISSSGTLSLKGNFLGYIKVAEIELDFPNLKSVQLNAFENQNYNLKSLAFTRSKMSQVPTFAMTQLSSLEEFEVSGSKEIEVLGTYLFRPLRRTSTLKVVKLTSNTIHVIEKDAFFDLLYLKSLNLRDNLIKEVDLYALPPNLDSLKELVFWDNKLESMPLSIMKKMSKGSSIDVYSNNISIVSAEDLDVMIKNNMKVMFGDNPLNCTCAFKELAIAVQKKTLFVESGTCAGPPSLKDRKLTSLSSEDDFSDCP